MQRVNVFCAVEGESVQDGLVVRGLRLCGAQWAGGALQAGSSADPPHSPAPPLLLRYVLQVRYYVKTWRKYERLQPPAAVRKEISMIHACNWLSGGLECVRVGAQRGGAGVRELDARLARVQRARAAGAALRARRRQPTRRRTHCARA